MFDGKERFIDLWHVQITVDSHIYALCSMNGCKILFEKDEDERRGVRMRELTKFIVFSHAHQIFMATLYALIGLECSFLM